MAIEKLIVEKIHDAMAQGQTDQERLAKTLLGELRFLQSQGLTDLPVAEKTVEQNLVPDQTKVGKTISVVDALGIKDTGWLGLPREEELGEAAKTLLEFIATRSFESPEGTLTLGEMGSFMEKKGFVGSKDTLRQHVYEIRGMLRGDKDRRFDLISVRGKGYRFVRLEQKRRGK